MWETKLNFLNSFRGFLIRNCWGGGKRGERGKKERDRKEEGLGLVPLLVPLLIPLALPIVPLLLVPLLLVPLLVPPPPVPILSSPTSTLFKNNKLASKLPWPLHTNNSSTKPMRIPPSTTKSTPKPPFCKKF